MRPMITGDEWNAAQAEGRAVEVDGRRYLRGGWNNAMSWPQVEVVPEPERLDCDVVRYRVYETFRWPAELDVSTGGARAWALRKWPEPGYETQVTLVSDTAAGLIIEVAHNRSCD